MRDFRSSERYVQAFMRWMHFAGRLTTLMIDASYVQPLTGPSVSTTHSILRNRRTSMHSNPTQVSTAQYFVLLFSYLPATIADVHYPL